LEHRIWILTFRGATRNPGHGAAFAREEMMPFARQWDEEEFFSSRYLPRGGAGLCRTTWPPMWAGRRLRLDAALVFEELAKAALRPPLTCYPQHGRMDDDSMAARSCGCAACLSFAAWHGLPATA
jgi:hypothetical protein